MARRAAQHGDQIVGGITVFDHGLDRGLQRFRQTVGGLQYLHHFVGSETVLGSGIIDLIFGALTVSSGGSVTSTTVGSSGSETVLSAGIDLFATIDFPDVATTYVGASPKPI